MLRALAPIAAVLAIALGAPAVEARQPAPAATGVCAGVGPQAESVPGFRSFTYASASGRDLKLHVITPAGSTPPRAAVLFFFGGGWRQGSVAAFADQARALAEHGVVGVLADYRVTCRDGTTVVDSTDDARAAYAWLRVHAADFDAPLDGLVLAGGSAGGQLALATAQQAAPGEEPAALLLFNPAPDLVSIAAGIGITPEQAAAISPSVLPVDRLPPTLIQHGEADHTVPISLSRDFCARAVAAGRACEVVGYPGRDHGFFNSHVAGPGDAPSPYDATLARGLAFLKGLGLAD